MNIPTQRKTPAIRTAIAILSIIVIVAAFGIIRARNIASQSIYQSEEHAEAGNPEAAGHEEQEEKGGHSETVRIDPESESIAGIKIEPVGLGSLSDRISVTGEVKTDANNTAKVGPRIEGKVISVSGNIGDFVRRGQILAVMTSTELAQAQADLRQVRTQLRLASDNFARQKKLASLGSFSRGPYEEARRQQISTESEVLQAESDLRRSKAELRRAEAEKENTKTKLARSRSLYQEKIVSRQDVESLETELRAQEADIDALQAQIGQAEGRIGKMREQLEIANVAIERESRILKGNLLANREVAAAQKEYEEAKVRLSAAADRVRLLSGSISGSGGGFAVTAPISGRVTERDVNIGQVVDPSAAMFTIVNTSNVWADLNVYSRDVSKVRPGQQVHITSDSYPGEVWQGTVHYVSDIVDDKTRTVQVRAKVGNPGGNLKQHMFVRAIIYTSRGGSAVTVPAGAVQMIDGKEHVFVAKGNGEFEAREISCDLEEEGFHKVTSGLQVGEHIVVQGSFQVKSQMSKGEFGGHGH